MTDKNNSLILIATICAHSCADCCTPDKNSSAMSRVMKEEAIMMPTSIDVAVIIIIMMLSLVAEILRSPNSPLSWHNDYKCALVSGTAVLQVLHDTTKLLKLLNKTKHRGPNPEILVFNSSTLLLQFNYLGILYLNGLKLV